MKKKKNKYKKCIEEEECFLYNCKNCPEISCKFHENEDDFCDSGEWEISDFVDENGNYIDKLKNNKI